jgi:hypothetical protein
MYQNLVTATIESQTQLLENAFLQSWIMRKSPAEKAELGLVCFSFTLVFRRFLLLRP